MPIFRATFWNTHASMNQWFSSLNKLTTLPHIRQVYRMPRPPAIKAGRPEDVQNTVYGKEPSVFPDDGRRSKEREPIQTFQFNLCIKDNQSKSFITERPAYKIPTEQPMNFLQITQRTRTNSDNQIQSVHQRRQTKIYFRKNETTTHSPQQNQKKKKS